MGRTKDPKIRVSEQFSKAIQDKRKQISPFLVKAKRDSKMSNLSYDKLYINNRMYTVQPVAQSGYTVDCRLGVFSETIAFSVMECSG